MRYLKSKVVFEEFVPLDKYLYERISLNDIYLDLNDICLDLEDDGFDVSVKHSKSKSKSYLSIDIERGKNERLIDRKFFEFNDDIQNTIIRINQYMRGLGFRTVYMTKGYSHVENYFVVTPGEKLIYPKNGLLISNIDRVLLIELIFSGPEQAFILSRVFPMSDYTLNPSSSTQK